MAQLLLARPALRSSASSSRRGAPQATLAGVVRLCLLLLGLAAAARFPPLLPVAEGCQCCREVAGGAGGTARRTATRAGRRPEEAEPDVLGETVVSPGMDISEPFARGGTSSPWDSGGRSSDCPHS